MSRRLSPALLSVLLLALVAATATKARAQAATDEGPILALVLPHVYATGTMTNTTGETASVDQHVVSVLGAPSLRLLFAGAVLGPNDWIEVRNPKDGERHLLTNAELSKWQNSSAYFNGDTLEVGLILGPGSSGSYSLSSVIRGTGMGGYPDTICGSTDDRVASADPRVARFVSSPTASGGGCTIWLISPDSCCLSAGHCFSGGSLQVAEFGCPPSLSGGALQHPPVANQYTIQAATVTFVNGGVGNDFGVVKLNPNNLGQQAGVNQGYFLLDIAIPNATDQIRITGHGTDTGVDNQVQQTHVGPFTGANGTQLTYQTDTTGGNSGSPVINETTGKAVGIHTHGGCGATGGSNSGTSLSLAPIMPAIQALCTIGNPTQPPVVSFTTSATTVQAGSPINFADTSANYPNTWAWDFNGDAIIDATTAQATFIYSVPGTYSVTLTATNIIGSASLTQSNLITVLPISSAVLPYSESFTTGLPTGNPAWTFQAGAPNGRIQAATSGSVSPASGGSAMAMDSSVSNSFATNVAKLRVDASGHTTVMLSFWYKETSDEDHAEDGVFLSDGTNVVQAIAFTGAISAWTHFSVDVGQIALSNGLLLGADFEIRFSQRDNYPVPTDGAFFDDISVIAPCSAGGQANAASATLLVGGAVDPCGIPAALGEGGPYSANVASGGVLVLTFGGLSNQPAIVIAGPKNPGNAIFLGAPWAGANSLDIGLFGSLGSFGDVLILIDGLSPSTTLDFAANTGPTGTKVLPITLPALPSGILTTIQAVILQGPTALRLTAATEVSIL